MPWQGWVLSGQDVYGNARSIHVTHDCVVWSELVDVPAEEPSAAIKEAEKRWSEGGSEAEPHSRVEQRVLEGVHEPDPTLEAVEVPGAEADIGRHSVHSVLLGHRGSALELFAYISQLRDVV